MKHQISKVALIATLAFIGVGFAGTQQAKAAGCDGYEPVDRLTCGDSYDDIEEYNPNGGDPLVCQTPTRVTNGSAGCWDTDGDCKEETLYGVRIEESICTNKNSAKSSNCDYVVYYVAGTCPTQ